MAKEDTVEFTVDFDVVPSPTGYRMLVKPLPADQYSEGGIDLSAALDAQKILCQIGLVIKLGPLCYDTKHYPERYGDTPWVKEGQWVMYGKYSGSRFKTKDGNEWILLNDDNILATVPEPRYISRLDYA